MMKTVFDPFSTVVITGASSGIGKACVQGIYTLNPRMAFCNLSRREPRFDQAGIRLVHFPCDLSQSKALAATTTALLDHCRQQTTSGGILLINNAGLGAYGHFPEPNLTQQTRMIDVNIRACVSLTGLLLPLLKERGGAIVNIASIAAFQPTPYLSVYGATKAFLLHWSLALGEELRPNRIRTLALCPGPTKTRFFAVAGFSEPPLESSGGETPEAVFQALSRALAKNKPLAVSGWRNRMLTALTGCLPKSLVARIAAMILRGLRLEAKRSD